MSQVQSVLLLHQRKKVAQMQTVRLKGGNGFIRKATWRMIDLCFFGMKRNLTLELPVVHRAFIPLS